MSPRDAQGRVHLALHRDPATGGARLTLDAPVFSETWQNELTAAAANTAYALLGDAPSLERTVELARNAMAATSRLAEGLLARAPEGGIACKAGCDHCCYQSVGVTPPEALAIVAHLKSTLSLAELTAVAAHVTLRHEKTRGLSAAERFSPAHPCPFLRAGRCSIYEVRPLACRGMNSLDAGECAKRLREPEARATFLAEGRGGHSFMEPIRAVHAVSAGLQLGLSEIFQLDMRPLELTAAIHLLLDGPESVPGAWLRGERSFESARSADGGHDPGLRELSGALPHRPDPANPPSEPGLPEGLAEGRAGILGANELPAASSLMSSRWSRDNLITGHPGQLYDGTIHERIGQDAFVELVADLETRTGPVRTSAGRMGVYTWDISCTDARGPFTLQVPLVLDERGRRERAKSDVPRLNVENMRYFTARGLTRFIVEPRDVMTLAGNVPAATFTALPDHHPITFGGGSIGIELAEAELHWVVFLGVRPTAHLLAEMIAALVYHYDPDTDGGTAVTDVCINDGDFAVKRRPDGSFEVRLTAARRREGGIGPNLFLLYLIQLLAYEDWSVDGDLVGLPMLVSNPSVAFEGLVRGLGYRCQDLGRPQQEGPREARRWIEDFGRSAEGRAYRPWVERFLAGRLPPTFGGDPRERWWRLLPLQTKLAVLELRARQAGQTRGRHSSGSDPGAREAASARALKTLLDRLSLEIGRVPHEDPGTVRVNDLGRDDLLRLLEEAGIPATSRDRVADEALALWPHRSLDHLVARVPGARSLRRLKSRLSFGRVVPQADQATTKSLGPPAKQGPGDAGATRPLANPEVFGGRILPPSLQELATRTFPTFEAYMDAALHDPQWGYYGHGVQIGKTGHFDTHPESLSPHYGRWVAVRAFDLWREMLARGELSESDAFPVVEFGAGNGRLARDLLDAVRQAADDPKLPERQRWQSFAARLDYRIYETSASLRERQRELLGREAIIAEGDARRPAETLKRDFPGGLKGLVVTNEVPDAFGVHKIAMTAEGRTLAALVVPRVEAALPDLPGEALSRRIADADEAVRRTFGFRGHPGDLYLDGATWALVMQSLAELSTERRQELLALLWFEEIYVSASVVPELGAHLAANADQYAIALGAEAAGVVLYVNVHAGRFIRELASSLAAGFIVTIDYGDTTWGLVQGARRGDFPFRVYGDRQDYVPRPNDPYAAPGTQDMTADVNFTELARAGEAAGLKVVHYGPERDLTGDDLPELVLSAASDNSDQGRAAKSWTDFWANPVFKLLVLGTRPSDLFSGPLMTPLPLSCREQDVPKSRRPRIAALSRAISSPIERRGQCHA